MTIESKHFFPQALHRLSRPAALLTFTLSGLFGTSLHAQVSISLQANDSAAIPGSQRSYYANITGSSNQGVNWTVSGGCSLSSSTGTPVVVTAPSTGGTCTSSATSTISFSSPVSCHITATAQDTSNGVKSASTILPVCSPSVSLNVFPQSTVLYKGQHAVIQSDLRGSVDTAVTWTLTSNPGGFASITGGTSNRHAIVSASAPGTYVVTATSVADPTQKSSSTIYVTNNAFPTTGLADHTEPVDCTAVGSGTTYEVGPARAYTNLDVVPWNSLNPGDTVRIHNDDLTGSSPTTYHQHVAIAATGTATEPIRICGVPDSHGNKPIIDGSNATSPALVNWAGVLEQLGVIILYDRNTQFDPIPDSNMNVLVEGLHIRNANPTFSYIAQQGATVTPYNGSAACIGVYTGRDELIRGNELENCSQGVFVNSQTPQGNIIYDLTVEGNYIHGWGQSGNSSVHGMYLQAIGLTAQFNYIGASVTGAPGNAIKSRSVLNFLRWNYISQPITSTARAFDMVEPQAFNCYVIPNDYAQYHNGTGYCNTVHDGAPSDPVTADEVAANYEAYHSDYIYGNVMDDSGSGSGYVHYGYDQQTPWGPSLERRGGTLFYWNNTHLSRPTNGYKVITEGAAPDQGHSYEFPVIQSINNLFGGNGTHFVPTVSFWQSINVDSNWLLAGYQLPNRANTDTYMGGTTAAEQATCDPYNNCLQGPGHVIWSRNNVAGPAASTVYSGTTAPFNFTSFAPLNTLQGLGTQLPAPIANQPSNMEFFPATATTAVRLDLTYLGALDDGTAPTTPAPAPAPTPTPTPTAPAPAPGPANPAPAPTAAPSTVGVATMTLTASPGLTIHSGTTFDLIVNLTGNHSMPTGTLAYSVDGVSSAISASASGTNMLAFPRMGVGSHLIRISYQGSSAYPAGASQQRLTFTVVP
jgi:hypothetical protein